MRSTACRTLSSLLMLGKFRYVEQLNGYAKHGVAGDAPELPTGGVPHRLTPPRATTARASWAALLHDLLVSLALRVEVHRGSLRELRLEEGCRGTRPMRLRMTQHYPAQR